MRVVLRYAQLSGSAQNRPRQDGRQDTTSTGAREKKTSGTELAFQKEKKSRKKDKLEGREEIISIKDDEPEGDWPDKKREVERLNMIFSLRGKSSDRAVCAFQFRGSARKIHTSAEWKKNSGGGE